MRYPRRKFLKGAAVGAACLTCSAPLMSTARAGVSVDPPREGEDIVAFITRQRGGWDETLYKQLLGAANEFKEGVMRFLAWRLTIRPRAIMRALFWDARH